MLLQAQEEALALAVQPELVAQAASAVVLVLRAVQVVLEVKEAWETEAALVAQRVEPAAQQRASEAQEVVEQAPVPVPGEEEAQ